MTLQRKHVQIIIIYIYFVFFCFLFIAFLKVAHRWKSFLFCSQSESRHIYTVYTWSMDQLYESNKIVDSSWCECEYTIWGCCLLRVSVYVTYASRIFKKIFNFIDISMSQFHIVLIFRLFRHLFTLVFSSWKEKNKKNSSLITIPCGVFKLLIFGWIMIVVIPDIVLNYIVCNLFYI